MGIARDRSFLQPLGFDIVPGESDEKQLVIAIKPPGKSDVTTFDYQYNKSLTSLI